MRHWNDVRKDVFWKILLFPLLNEGGKIGEFTTGSQQPNVESSGNGMETGHYWLFWLAWIGAFQVNTAWVGQRCGTGIMEKKKNLTEGMLKTLFF